MSKTYYPPKLKSRKKTPRCDSKSDELFIKYYNVVFERCFVMPIESQNEGRYKIVILERDNIKYIEFYYPCPLYLIDEDTEKVSIKLETFYGSKYKIEKSDMEFILKVYTSKLTYEFHSRRKEHLDELTKHLKCKQK